MSHDKKPPLNMLLQITTYEEIVSGEYLQEEFGEQRPDHRSWMLTSESDGTVKRNENRPGPSDEGIGFTSVSAVSPATQNRFRLDITKDKEDRNTIEVVVHRNESWPNNEFEVYLDPNGEYVDRGFGEEKVANIAVIQASYDGDISDPAMVLRDMKYAQVVDWSQYGNDDQRVFDFAKSFYKTSPENPYGIDFDEDIVDSDLDVVVKRY